MTQQRSTDTDPYAHFSPPATPTPESRPQASTNIFQRHGWLMWLMCLPMLIVVAALMAAGTIGAGGLLYALGCLAMMAVMMLWMTHGTGASQDR